MNLYTLIIEITLSIITIVAFLSMLKPVHHIYFKNYIGEDIYASLTSLNYINFTLEDICNITKEIIPSNYIYNISVNNTYICGDIVNNKLEELGFILVKNGTIYNITIKIGK